MTWIPTHIQGNNLAFLFDVRDIDVPRTPKKVDPIFSDQLVRDMVNLWTNGSYQPTYLFDTFEVPGSPGPGGGHFDQVMRRMVDLWANFATFHKPIPMAHQLLEGNCIDGRCLLSGSDLLDEDWYPVNLKNNQSYVRVQPSHVNKTTNSKLDHRFKILEDLIAFS